MARRGFNVEAFEARVKRLPKAIRDAAHETLETYTDQAVERLKANYGAVADSGRSAASVRKEEGRTSLSIDVKAGGDTAPYVPASEFGHDDPHKPGKHVPAHPIFFPVIRITKKKFRSGLTPKVRKAMKSVCNEGGKTE